jgi:cation:H+ antiporter
MNIILIVLGLVVLTVGADVLVRGASRLAAAFGVAPLIIGLTIVAFGTSAPELAVSVGASLSGQSDVALGNVVGSNIFNVLCVLGGAAIVAPGGIPVSTEVVQFDLPVMMLTSLICLPIFFTGGEISRWEGAMFLTVYVVYLAYLVLNALDHAVVLPFTHAVVFVAGPLTALVLIISFARSWRARSRLQGGDGG